MVVSLVIDPDDPEVVPVAEPEVVVDPVVVPVLEPADMPAEAEPPAALWNAWRCVRNSSSFARTAGSMDADAEALPLVPTDPVVPVALVEPDAAPPAESSDVTVWSTCE